MAEGPTAIRLLSACPRPLPPTLYVASPDASSVVAGVHGVCTPYGSRVALHRGTAYMHTGVCCVQARITVLVADHY